LTDVEYSRSPAPERPSLRAPLLTFFAVTAVASGLFWLARGVPFLRGNLHAFIAVMFFYAPVAAERWQGRHFDFQEAGLDLWPWRTNLAVLGATVAVTFPPFVAGFFWFYDLVCARAPTGLSARLSTLCPTAAGWLGWTHGHLRLPGAAVTAAVSQLIVVAIPEELFFRGYLLGKLEERWAPRRSLFGAPVSLALPASALLFALGHFLVDFNPQRLAVFFPGLVFGWMRLRARSLAAGSTFHALCNVLSDVLHASYFA
jgi:membrane protease YdiL (CAAX protease family)